MRLIVTLVLSLGLFPATAPRASSGSTPARLDWAPGTSAAPLRTVSERCVGVAIVRSRLIGSRASTHENIKANQSRDLRVRDSLISGAEQNALDFVAVRGARLTGNTFERARDWCSYTEGGSSNVAVTDNLFRDCGTSGYLAGQGSWLQYMVAPFLHHEAVGTTVRRNTFRNIQGAAFGVNAPTTPSSPTTSPTGPAATPISSRPGRGPNLRSR